ncbi:MAG TPA: DUF3971 domain-containing protein [Steroidobacteraceae bacterium]|nr:DUF3971 domain-containing protein [Steroidobacteraceae bacterium]
MTPAEPAAGSAAAAASPGAAARLRLGLTLLSCTCALLIVALGAYALAAARVPAQRAQLEALIRHETGLEISFSQLSLRWGWYGPEAVLQSVTLGQPDAPRALLQAPRLVVSLDLWRLARSGELAASHVTLENPDIELALEGAGPAATAAPAGARARVLPQALRLLSSWHGGRIDIVGGTLNLSGGADTPVTLGLRAAQLYRNGTRWNADAQLLLPASLGATAHLTLQLSGDPALPEALAGELVLESERLEFAGWHELAGSSAPAKYLPDAGRGSLTLRAALAHGRLASIDGSVDAEALKWPARAGQGEGFTLAKAAGRWQLARHGAEWQLSAQQLVLAAEPTPVPATLRAAAAADGSYLRGTLQHAPLAVLAALARWREPQLPLPHLGLAGEASALRFDWNGQRAPGERLALAARLQHLDIHFPQGRLSGLRAELAGSESTLDAQLSGDDAELDLTGLGGGHLSGLALATRLRLSGSAAGWLLTTDELSVRRDTMQYTASGTLAGGGDGTPQLSAHLAAHEVDLAQIVQLLGTRALGDLGAAAAHISAGRMQQAELDWRGPLSAATAVGATGTQFSGTLGVRAAALSAQDEWPAVEGIAARLDWRGSHWRAVLEQAASGSFRLTRGSAEWDARGTRPLRLVARLSGRVEEGLAWLGAHPQLAPWARAAGSIDLRGDSVVELAASVPVDAQRGLRAHVRLAALLDQATLRPVAGLPPIGALHGTLAFSDGALQRSTVSGKWLGGPVALTVAQHDDAGEPVLTLSGRGLMSASEVLHATGALTAPAPLSGSAEWSAQLSAPLADAGSRWQLRADSSLAGLASTLPEPFAKTGSLVLPLHLELAGEDGAALLRLALGERLRAAAQLSRSGDTWRIGRGALRFAANMPPLPAEALLTVDGRVRTLDLAACLLLARQAGADAALPALRANLTANTLAVGSSSYAEVMVSAATGAGGGALELQSPRLRGSARWPARLSAAAPAHVHLASFDLAQPADGALGAALAAALAPASDLRIDEFSWQGHPLGALSAVFGIESDALSVREFTLSGASTTAHASARCQNGECAASVSLDSSDVAATLAAFGLRGDISARSALLAGQLHWDYAAAVPLATLGGHLHMQVEDGVTRREAAPGVSFGLLAVPALLAALGADVGEDAERPLHFASLVADYQLADGEATTSGLHFDGDAEILVRGRVGIANQDYDAQAWILRGEERLPDTVRRLAATPRIAAAWLALRELFGAPRSDPRRSALSLRGSWNDPIVGPVE